MRSFAARAIVPLQPYTGSIHSNDISHLVLVLQAAMCALKKARHVLVKATPKNEAESPQHLEDSHDSLLTLAPQLQQCRKDGRTPKVIPFLEMRTHDQQTTWWHYYS